MSEANGQLVRTVVAQPGTRAEAVFERMKEANERHQVRGEGIALEFAKWGSPEVTGGLKLVPKSQKPEFKTYSLRYAVAGDWFVIEIGDKLPEHRLDNAATSILAMIKRGRSEGREAYGPVKKLNNRRYRRRRERAQEESFRRQQ